jgi:hypothetical protein
VKIIRRRRPSLQCPERYYYTHVLGLRGSRGQDFVHYHTVLRRAFRRIGQAEAGISTTAARAMLDEEWKRPHAEHRLEGV